MKILKYTSILIGLIFIFTSCTVFTQEDTSPNTNNETDQTITRDSSFYITDYSIKEFEKAIESGTTLLYFRADWCPTCRVLDKELIERGNELPNHLTILTVDYDSETQLKKDHKVTIQHTLIQIDKNGNEIKRWTGGGIDILKEELDISQLEAEERTERIVIKSVDLQNDFEGAKVDKKDLLEGCFGGKDCIQSIENPKFEAVTEADEWLNDEDIIFGLNYKGVTRAYPQRILNWHEIVNDTVAEDPIAVTFCPLCGSAIAYERKVNNVITEFGVSGKLYNSDLVMYDRYEGNLWEQITGQGIVGPAARRDEKLKQILVITTTWGNWKKEYPKSKVLSKETGFIRDYDEYPYGTYEENDELYFGVKNLDKKLQIKTVVYGIEIGDKSKAYPKAIIDSKERIEDSLNKQTILIEKLESGEIKFTNLSLNEKITPIRLFWFAWAAFHPDTEIYL